MKHFSPMWQREVDLVLINRFETKKKNYTPLVNKREIKDKTK